jgi:lysophospholipase L1-like esterase
MRTLTPSIPSALSTPSLLLFLFIPFLAFAQPTASPAPDLTKNPAPTRNALNPALPTLFIAGDSTAARGRGERQQGWAEPFATYFDSAKINVANRARGGRSSRTFVTEGLWDQILTDLKPGDFVIIQFGHNDGGPVNEDESIPKAARRARGSLPGLGDETKAIDNIITQKPEVVHTFGSYLRKMIADTQAKGATPILLSLTLRNIWNDGRIERTSRYSKWSAETAIAARVAFFDLSTAVADKLDALGAEKTAALYPQDHTHFNAVGADLHAATVAAGLKNLPTLSLAKFLK